VLLNWLRTNVYRHGRKFTPNELMKELQAGRYPGTVDRLRGARSSAFSTGSSRVLALRRIRSDSTGDRAPVHLQSEDVRPAIVTGRRRASASRLRSSSQSA